MKLLKFLSIVTIILGLSISNVSADVDKGQKIYSKKMKKLCGFNGAKFAAKYSQDEWEEFKDSNKLPDIFGQICPKGDKYFHSDKFKKYINDLYDFVYEYANDSGNVPSC